MQHFTDGRSSTTDDEVWLVQHPPVYTQGQAGKPEHLLAQTEIPVIQSNRGGQITYHAPGQQIMYVMVNLRRLGINVRRLVSVLEQTVIQTLADLNVQAHSRDDAPGVYVGVEKIASLGLRIRNGCSFHGLALNVDMDLEPFSHINPCGYAGLRMTQLKKFVAPIDAERLQATLLQKFTGLLGYRQTEFKRWRMTDYGQTR